jgi:hypothetical protein
LRASWYFTRGLPERLSERIRSLSISDIIPTLKAMGKNRHIPVEQMDLWADSDGDGLSSGIESDKRVVPRGKKRRLAERAIHAAVRDWLLRHYAAAYCRSLAATRIFRRCYWVDALGGDGRLFTVASNPETVPASFNGKGRKKGAVQQVPPALQPIVTLSRELMQESRPIALHALLLASDSNRHREMHTAQAAQNGHAPTSPIAIAIAKEGTILHATWQEAAVSVLSEIGQSPAIFLLNPLSPVLFSADDLARLCQRAVPTELCLLISHKQIVDRLLAASTIPIQATALNALLRTDRWKTLSTTSEEQTQAISGFTDLLIASLQRHFQLPIQLTMFPMLIGPATVEPAPCTLLFATRRQDSLHCMNDAVYLYRQQIEDESYCGVLGQAWFLSQQQERQGQALQDLYQRILQQGQSQHTRRWPDLRQHLLLDHFGQFRLCDYDAGMQQLLRNGAVRCAWRQPAISPEEDRVPGNDDTLLW